MNGMKKCFGCGQEKPYSEFYQDRYAKDGHKPRCILCERKRKWAKGKGLESYCRGCGCPINKKNKTKLCKECMNIERHEAKLANLERLSEARRAMLEAKALEAAACQPGGYAISQPGQAWGWNGRDLGPELGMMRERTK